MKNLVTGLQKNNNEIELHSKVAKNTENNLTFMIMSLVIALITWVFTGIFLHLYNKHSGDASLSSHYHKLMIAFLVGGLLSLFSLVYFTTKFFVGGDRILLNNNTFTELEEMSSNKDDRDKDNEGGVKTYSLKNSLKLLIKSDELEGIGKDSEKDENTKDGVSEKDSERSSHNFENSGSSSKTDTHLNENKEKENIEDNIHHKVNDSHKDEESDTVVLNGVTYQAVNTDANSHSSNFSNASSNFNEVYEDEKVNEDNKAVVEDEVKVYDPSEYYERISNGYNYDEDNEVNAHEVNNSGEDEVKETEVNDSGATPLTRREARLQKEQKENKSGGGLFRSKGSHSR